MRCALTIAGSDSIGGAGIQADIKAMASLGVHATCVVTAVTAQNTQEVVDIYPVPEEFIKTQLYTILKDVDIKAVKTGMLYSPEIVSTVADILYDHETPLVVDPVMIAGVGDDLSSDGFSKAVKKELLPICELVTPNKHEAEVLSGMKIHNEDDAMFACELIGKEGSSVLLKGGHMNTKNVVDYLYLSSEFTRMENPRLEVAGHGGGCTLSSYITAHMAKGIDIVNSVLRSRDLIQNSIASMYSIGEGVKVVNPMTRMHDESVRFTVLDSVDVAAKSLVNNIPEYWVLQDGINIAYAAKNAAGPEDIAAIDRRISIHNGLLRKNGSAKFGAAEHLSYILLAMMKSDSKCRSILSLSYREDLLDIMEEVGFIMAYVESPGDVSIMDGVLISLRECDETPDVIVNKHQKTVYLLAEDPAEILKKVDYIL